jgi:uncharacterized protein YjiS (DUF1127 family)
MSTVHEISKWHQQSANTGRAAYSPLEAYWNAFKIWRKRRMLQTELSSLTDRELIDIGITRGEIDYVSSKASDITKTPTLDVRYW